MGRLSVTHASQQASGLEAVSDGLSRPLINVLDCLALPSFLVSKHWTAYLVAMMVIGEVLHQLPPAQVGPGTLGHDGDRGGAAYRYDQGTLQLATPLIGHPLGTGMPY